MYLSQQLRTAAWTVPFLCCLGTNPNQEEINTASNIYHQNIKGINVLKENMRTL